MSTKLFRGWSDAKIKYTELKLCKEYNYQRTTDILSDFLLLEKVFVTQGSLVG